MGKTKIALSASWEQALAGEAGGKAQALAQLMQAEIGRVPPFLALLPNAYQSRQDTKQPNRTSKGAGHHSRPLNSSPEVSEEVEQLVSQALPNLGQGLFAVRASSLNENPSRPIASYLNVWPQDVAGRIAAIWQASALHHPEHQAQTGVLIMPMIKAQVSGVAYSADPKTGERGRILIQAMAGANEQQPQQLRPPVPASTQTSTDNPESAHAQPQAQAMQTYQIGANVIYEGVPTGEQPLLSEAQIREVAGLAQACAAHFGKPQELEWAFDDTGLWLLQSRDITQIVASDLYFNDPEVFWDNRLAGSYYGGITSPLTFSFAQHTQQLAYRNWLTGQVTGPQLHLDSHKQRLVLPAIHNLLGYYQGRIYDNISQWSSLLSVLPTPVSGGSERHIETLSGSPLLSTVGGSLSLPEVDKLRHWQSRIGAQREAFYKRLKRALHPAVPTLPERSLVGLAAYYRELEAELLQWDVPLQNEALALLYYDLLRHLCTNWLHDENENLHNDLLMSLGSLWGSEAVLRLSSVATTVPQDYLPVLENGTLLEVDMVVPELSKRAMESYLQDFGDSNSDLKLESPSLGEDLLSAWRAVGRQMRYGTPDHNATQQRDSAEELAMRRLKPFQRPLFSWVLKHAREAMRHKANFHHERLRVVGRVRSLLHLCGKRLTETGMLAHPDDVFLLQLNEVLGLAEGSYVGGDLRNLVDTRRNEQLRYQATDRPASRFVVRGSFRLAKVQSADPDLSAEQANQARRGQNAVSGKVHGIVRLMHQAHTPLREPSILVMRRLHPQWLLLYPMIRGLIVEEASPLSEGVLLARELGVPLIIGLPEAMSWLRDGDIVDMDGQTGLVSKQNRRLESKSGQWQERAAEWVDMES